MTIAHVPHRFVDATNFDPESVNDNLEAISRQVQRNLDKRYTYSSVPFPLDGITDASAEVLRQIALRRVSANAAIEVCSFEVVLYGNAEVTATVTCSDSTWPALEFTTSSVVTTEATAISPIPVSIPSSAADVTFTISFSAAYTCTRGYFVVHLRSDRGNQGTSHAGYSPTLIDAASSTLPSLLDTELTNLGAAVARDTANDVDLRCDLFAVRDLAAGSTVNLRLPSGARRLVGTVAYVCAVNTVTATITVTGTNLSGSSVIVVGTGATTRMTNTDAASGSMPDDPMDSTDDAVVSIPMTGTGSAALTYVWVYWS